MEKRSTLMYSYYVMFSLVSTILHVIVWIKVIVLRWGSNSEPSNWESVSLTIWPSRHVGNQFGNFSDSIFIIMVNWSKTFDYIKCINKLTTRIDWYNLEKPITLFSRLGKKTISMLKWFPIDYSLVIGRGNRYP